MRHHTRRRLTATFAAAAASVVLAGCGGGGLGGDDDNSGGGGNNASGDDPCAALDGETVTFVVPVFAVFYGVLFLGEEVTTWMLLCGLVIVCGTALSSGLLRLGRR